MPEILLFSPGGASEATLLDVLEAVKSERRLKLDYTGGPTSSDPVYIGTAALDATVTDAVWTIRKLTYSSGNVTGIEVRTSLSWNARATPTPAWES